MSDQIRSSLGTRLFRVALMFVLVSTVIVNPAATLTASAASKSGSEQEVKAAFVYNFVRYVVWPDSSFESASSPIRLTILGSSGFVRQLEQSIGRRTVRGRALQVNRATDLSSVDESHLVFVGRSSPVTPAELLASVRGQSIFTVSDLSGFARLGGIANFVQVGEKIRFEINETAAKRAGLKISSRLLQLATIVN